jgi:energy-coupling factor transporter ATP-binding protein EcfA2
MDAFLERLPPRPLLAHMRAIRGSAGILIALAALPCSSSLLAQKAPLPARRPNTLGDSARQALRTLDSISQESRRILLRVDSASHPQAVSARPGSRTATPETGRRVTGIAQLAGGDSVVARKQQPVIIAVIPAVAEPDSLVEILLGRATAVGDNLSLRDAVPDSILAQQVETVRFSSLVAPIVSRHGRSVIVRVPSHTQRGSQPSIVSEGPNWTTPPYTKFAVGGFEEIRRAAWQTGLWYVLALLGVVSAFIAWRAHVSRRLTSEKESMWRAELDGLRFEIDRNIPASRRGASLPDELDEESVSWEETSADQEDARLTAEIPDDLVAACSAGSCVLIVGPGASAQAGYPTRWEMLLRLQKQFAHTYDLTSDLRFAMKSGDSEAASELIASKVPPEELRAVVNKMYDIERELPTLHQNLAKIPFRSAYTTNWDALLERTFPDRNPLVVTLGRTAENLDAALKPDQFIIGKLFGAADASDSFLFLTDEFRRSLFRNPFITKLIMSELSAKTWLFLGTSLESIQRFVSALPERNFGIQRHFAVVPFRPDWSIHAERLRSKSGIELLGFTPTAGFPQVWQFARALGERVERTRALAPVVKPPHTSATNLTRVVLQNLGPFESLQLDLNPQWNVFLGNNGSGKSTILRAIALALSGDDSTTKAAAERLLRVGSSEGRVEVTVDGVTYTTIVKREPTGVSVQATQFTPLQRGTATVLGFPPLRGLSMKNPSGAAPTNSASPTVGDVAPLLGGTIDARMDNLKQWVVNVDVNSVSGGDITAERAARSGALRDAFFQVLQDLSPNTVVKFSSVDRHSWQVNVETPDGIVPIDQVSQGMSSLLGWVGTTLQRMYEIRPGVTNPESEPAIVLVDEIDAHLHPEWQQLLVPLLTKQFPRTQFIATTHSPLVVAGMKANEVFVAQRSIGNTKRVSVEPAPLEFEGMRADQILTSPLFGLSTSRSPSAASDMDRYAALLSKPDSLKSEEERAALVALRAKLDPFISIGETPLQRAVESAVRKAVKEVPILPDEGPGPIEISEDAALEIHRQLSELFSQPSESK